MSALKDVALQMVGIGWYVFPLGVKSKMPNGNLAPNGFKSASNDPAQVESWWTASPDANIGIDLGRSNLTVLDFDKGEPPAELNLPPTLTVKTSRGTHVYFVGTSKQGDMYLNNAHIGEIKSAGGYVLGPFSIHPEGPKYTPTSAHGIDIAPVPTTTITKLFPTREPVDASLNGAKIPHGQHDITLYRIGCKLRQMGLEEEAIKFALIEICEKRCENYGSDYKDMCERKAQQACKHEAGVDRTLEFNQNTGVQQQQQPAQVIDISKWREGFRQLGQMEDGPILEVIKGVLQEGVCFLGANASDGKTLVALSMAKAICTGAPLFGLSQFSVPEPRQVIYLIPESKDRAFRKRLEAFHIPDSAMFLCRTTSAGPTMPLDDPYLMQAVKDTNAVVFLDTAARFMKTTDENSAAQNQALVNDVFTLCQAGAIAVVLLHHATKASANEAPTLENMLRGTGDFAAMCDMVYGIRKDRVKYSGGAGPMEIDFMSLKDREQIGQLISLRLAASRKTSACPVPVSIINETGDFQVIDKRQTSMETVDALLALIKIDPTATTKDLAREVGIKEFTVKNELSKAGWHRVKGGPGGSSPWHQDPNGKCPYDIKKNTVEVKPLKKTYDLTLDDTIQKLAVLLAGTAPDGSYVLESEVYQRADKWGVSDSMLTKARRRLGVKVEKLEEPNESGEMKKTGQRVWCLPLPTDGAAAVAGAAANAEVKGETVVAA